MVFLCYYLYSQSILIIASILIIHSNLFINFLIILFTILHLLMPGLIDKRFDYVSNSIDF